MYVTSCGMLTPVGLTFPAATAAMRAGIAGFTETSFHDGSGKPVIGAAVPLEAEGFLGPERLLHMLVPAVRECLGERGLAHAPKVALILCLSEPQFPGRMPVLDTWLPRALQKELGVSFHAQSGVLAEGRAGAIAAVEIARALLAGREVSACLIAGVDSYFQDEALGAYARGRRLKTEKNPDGIIPGEAAAAILLSLSPPPADRPWPIVQIASTGLSHEPVSPTSNEPILGIGLADAVKKALAASGLAMTDIDLRISDLTGERYGFRETNYAVARVLRGRKEFLHLWHCMDSIGDTGAAAGPCMLARAVAAFAKGYAPGPNILCQSSAESGRRAAAVLRWRPKDPVAEGSRNG
jgi:3-oxoacyl-[acyl-carrier-protein] synthase-1